MRTIDIVEEKKNKQQPETLSGACVSEKFSLFFFPPSRSAGLIKDTFSACKPCYFFI